ncbi:MAG: BMP family protein, partial [Candidatus Methanofastidiosia archaeon]
VLATGGLGDKSFNDSAFAGAKKAEQELGIELDYVEPTAIAEYEGFLRDYAKSGEYSIIISIGFDQADALSVVAKEYPEQKFAIVDMVVDLPNIASFVFRENESSFLVGAIAGMITETNKIGFVGGMDIPLINKFLAGYKAGAKHVNPDVEVYVVYVGGWADPAKGKELALSQIDKGADIVYQAAGRSGLGVIEAAKERDIYAIGVDADQRYLAPDNILTSALKRVDVAVYRVIKSVIGGTFSGGIYDLGIKENGVGAVLDNNPSIVTQDIVAKVRELEQKVASGEIQVPTEP